MRRALVLGNSNYGFVSSLRSSRNDAVEMRNALNRLHFDVDLHLNFESTCFAKIIDDFASRLTENDVALLYYSGHGMQLNGRNYIVSVDFAPGEIDRIGLIDVQALLDKINGAAQRIILLDACRSDESMARLVAADLSPSAPVTKEVSERVAGAPFGFAEMKATSNTFIGFAAAPGEFALDGVGQLSPFTKALLDNLEVIDLPLSNLAARVRLLVHYNTGGQQRTWDQSSLTSPFYFNKGTLMLFMSNALTLLALILSAIPYSCLLLEMEILETPYWWIIISLTIPFLSLVLFVYTVQKTYIRLRDNVIAKVGRRQLLADPLQRGCIGGFLGSTFGATLMSIVYCRMAYAVYVASPLMRDRPNEGMIMTQISIAAAIFACLLGSFCTVLPRLGLLSGYIAVRGNESNLNTLVGSAVGGVSASVIVAPVAMLYFGRMPLPQVRPELLLPTVIAAAPLIVFSIIIFDFEKISNRRLVASAAAAVSSVAVGAVATAIVFGPLYKLQIVQRITAELTAHQTDTLIMTLGGIAYGVPVGVVLGAVIGFASILSEKWSFVADF